MAEGDQRSRVVSVLKKAGLDPISVENSVYPGTPDVNFLDGWLELKWLRAWPVRESTIVRIDHFTPQQRVWLRRRWRAGGGAFLLLQCRQEWMLFTGDEAADHVGKVTKAVLIKHAVGYWKKGLKEDSLLHLIEDPNLK